LTNDLTRRVWEHHSGEILGSTSRYKIHRLIHFEHFEGIRQANACEKEVKSWSRSRKTQLIESHNPGWKDLSLEWLPDKRERYGTNLQKNRSA